MKPAAAALKLRAQINALSPTATIVLVVLVVALAAAGCIRAVGAIQPNVTVLTAGQPEPEMATAAPVAEVIVPLEAPEMPPISPEARRLIKVSPTDPARLFAPQANDVWRQMSPPFAAPGVDLCSWRLTVDRETGHLVATPEADEGVPLFDLEAPPCRPGSAPQGPADGRLPSASTTTSVPAVASGPSR